MVVPDENVDGGLKAVSFAMPPVPNAPPGSVVLIVVNIDENGAVTPSLMRRLRRGDEKRQLIPGSTYREEKPIWVSEDTIVFRRIDGSYHASLWSVTKDGLRLGKLADLPVLPDQAFGTYGYIDWGEYFDVWSDD